MWKKKGKKFSLPDRERASSDGIPISDRYDLYVYRKQNRRGVRVIFSVESKSLRVALSLSTSLEHFERAALPIRRALKSLLASATDPAGVVEEAIYYARTGKHHLVTEPAKD